MSDNPFAALLGVNRPEKQPDPLCNLIENVFLLTLSKEASSKKGIVYLEDVARTFPGRELDLEVLEHALFERLVVSSPRELVFSKNMNERACQSHVITYLHQCYDSLSLVKDKTTKQTMKALIMRNVMTSLKQPDLYTDQNLFAQCFDIFKEYVENEEFFNEVLATFIEEESEYSNYHLVLCNNSICQTI